MSREKKLAAALLVAAATSSALSGCGTPGAPLPPSLNLPDHVDDLSAVRTGDQVSLRWTMPRRNTDKLRIKGQIDAHICRTESPNPESPKDCTEVGSMTLMPGVEGSFAEDLPGALAAGAPRPLRYFVELRNARGRSAGLSNVSVVLAGQAPAPVTALAAELKRSGVVLRWNALTGEESIRLHRVLLNPPASKPAQNPLAAAPEAVNQSLLVDHDSGIAIDKDVRFDRSYEYRAQRIARVAADGKTFELAGALSAPIRIDVRDVFPPSAPTGLAAVATAPGPDLPASIDLNWQPLTDPDVVGYFVYRREQQTPWERISGAQPLVAPAFHDAAVIPGHAYIYAVSAVDTRGNESARSSEAEETVPTP